MLVIFLTLFFLKANCEIPIKKDSDNTPLECSLNILKKYYNVTKELTYVDVDRKADKLLRSIHELNQFSITTRTPLAYEPSTLNDGYIIVCTKVDEFIEIILNLYNEPSWNPDARFLILIKLLLKEELRRVFNALLVVHVKDVVVLNGSSTAELYTYNPFENYACGKYYTGITEFGKCSDLTANIYPNKVVTGLKNCFFNVTVPHWPPYGIDPSKVKDRTPIMGTEQYIFHMMSEIEQFQYKFRYNYDSESFSVVTNNMTVSGPLSMIQENLTDIILGGLFLLPTRAKKFFYIYGHLDQVDEIRIIVKKAWETPEWMDSYLEFSPMTWGLLVLSLALYSILVLVLMKTDDKGLIVMALFGSLLSHGRSFNCRHAVKTVFIIWVWFAFLVNSFYTTSLMSLTMMPSLSYQISDEETVVQRGLKPCMSSLMDTFRRSELGEGHLNHTVPTKGCEKFLDSIKTVSKSKNLYTMAVYAVYLYQRHSFYDKYGRPKIYSIKKPYTKIIYSMYLYKGFPMHERLHSLALRIRETGLSDKSLNDHYYRQNIKYHFHTKGFESRCAVPWYVYIIGVCISSMTLLVEIGSRFKN